MAGLLLTGYMPGRAPVYMHCVHGYKPGYILDAASGLAVCRSFRFQCAFVVMAFGLVSLGPLCLAVVHCWVNHCFGSWVLPAIFYLLRLKRLHTVP